MNKRACVTLWNSNSRKAKAFKAYGATPGQLYELIKQACNESNEGDSIAFRGLATATSHLDALDCTRLKRLTGHTMNRSHLIITAQHDAKGPKEAGPAIRLGNTTVEHMTLQSLPADPTEDAALIGPVVSGVPEVTLRKVRLIGQDWTYYTWPGSGDGTKLLAEDCEIHFARQGFSQGGNNATKSDWTLRRCTFYGDANGSVSYGDTSGPDVVKGGVLSAVVFRAGTLLLDECRFACLKGLTKPYVPNWGCPRIAAVTDHYYSPGNKGTNIVIKNCVWCDIEPGTAQACKHIDMRWGKYELVGPFV